MIFEEGKDFLPNAPFHNSDFLSILVHIFDPSATLATIPKDLEINGAGFAEVPNFRVAIRQIYLPGL